MSHDIFISYSRRDTERMQQIRDGLRAAGLTMWTDEGIEPGTQSWKKRSVMPSAIVNRWWFCSRRMPPNLHG